VLEGVKQGSRENGEWTDVSKRLESPGEAGFVWDAGTRREVATGRGVRRGGRIDGVAGMILLFCS